MKLGPNFDALLGGFQVNWPSLLILSRHRVLVVTSVVSVLVVEASIWLRHIFGGADVATA